MNCPHDAYYTPTTCPPSHRMPPTGANVQTESALGLILIILGVVILTALALRLRKR